MKEIPFERSFASNPKSQFWYNKNILKPHQVTKSTAKKYIFDCNVCTHDFEISPGKITHHNRWCAYCTNQKLCNNENCKDCFNKSFASIEKSIYWSDKNDLIPRQIFKTTQVQKYLFNCNVCSHEFEQRIDHVTNEVWCPYCSTSPKKLCENNDCKMCFNKSFASHPKSKFWSNKNILTPRQVFKVTSSKFLFNCNKCSNEYETALSNKWWCTKCRFKTELKLFDWLRDKNFEVKTQGKFYWCKNKRHLPFDFV